MQDNADFYRQMSAQREAARADNDRQGEQKFDRVMSDMRDNVLTTEDHDSLQSSGHL